MAGGSEQSGGTSALATRKPYGMRAAAYGDGGSAAGVSGLTGIGQASPYGQRGGAQYGGLGTASAQGSMSGLARFGGGASGFAPRAYMPGKYQPGMSLSLSSPATGTPGATGGGLLGTRGDSGDGQPGVADNSHDPGNWGISATPGQVGRVAGILGALTGIPGAGMLSNATGLSRGVSDTLAAHNDPNYSHEGMNYGAGGGAGYGGESSGYGGGLGIGADGSGTAGTSDAGGSGSDGTDGGNGGGWARGGWVTKDRLRGKNPKGPDDGYGALDVGELVVPRKIAQKLPPQAVATLTDGGGK